MLQFFGGLLFSFLSFINFISPFTLLTVHHDLFIIVLASPVTVESEKKKAGVI